MRIPYGRGKRDSSASPAAAPSSCGEVSAKGASNGYARSILYELHQLHPLGPARDREEVGAYGSPMRVGAVTYRVLTVAAAAFVVASLSGCTFAKPVDPIVESASPPVATPTSASPVLGVGSTSLLCSQRADGEYPDVYKTLGGRVQLDLLDVGIWPSVPLARDVGLTVPSDRGWLFRKSPIVVAAGNESVTVSVSEDGKQFLAWVPVNIWTSGTPPDLTEWSRTSITMQPCSDQATAFLGGVLALTSDQCFTMHFQTDSGVSDDQQVRLDGQACDS